MGTTKSLSRDAFWQEGPFQFIKPDDFNVLGIDPAYVPLGTFASFKHPSQLRSSFGGNAYGFGLFEDYGRLKKKEIRQLQTIAFENPEEIGAHYKDLNEIYRKMGLLIRFSSLGKPYYLIPVHLMSNTLTHIKAKVDEISKIIEFHGKKYLKEHHKIGVLSRQDDLILDELSLRFKEHHFFVLDSSEKLRDLNQSLDLVILTSDLYEIVLMERFSPLAQESLSKKPLDRYCTYLLWKIYNLLKTDGEIFVIADHFTAKTNRSIRVTFKTEQEEKNFALFTHIFGTKKRSKIGNHSADVNIFDLQKYLSGLYVEQDVINTLLGGRSLQDMPVEEINNLPHIHSQFTDWPLFIEQEKAWSKLLSVFFDKIFLKPVIPDSVKDEWETRFTCVDYAPRYMIIYLGQKSPLKTTIADVKRDTIESNLAGCPVELMADYRDSFGYLIRTLQVMDRVKRGNSWSLPQIYIDRLRQPLENKKRRFSSLNDVIRLISKINRLKRVKTYLNPDNIEGPKTELFKNLEALTFFGFSRNEIREIVLIALGHTPLGRIISGKTTEKAMQTAVNMARTYEPQQALNMLRYCRLMTFAETAAARRAELTHEQVAQLFDLYESTVRVVINKELDWDQLLDEKISSMGGIHNKIIQKIFMMMFYYEFLDNWAELRHKGEMEKESLADYDKNKLARIENAIRLVNIIEQFEEMYLKLDPLQLPAFYRKFLEVEFHGTGHLFERMDSQNVFVLLWITVNLAQGEIVNFNSILADVEIGEIEDRVRKVEQEAMAINIQSLDLSLLKNFREQLKQNGTSFILGTGFQLRVSTRTQALEIAYKDMDKDMKRIASLSDRIAGHPISKIPVEELKNLETLFANLQSFCESHLRLLQATELVPGLPARQKKWFRQAEELREKLRFSILDVMFRPEYLYTDLNLLFQNAPSVLDFVLPEFMALQHLDISGHLYLTSPVPDYIIAATKKFQALVTHDKQNFQDVHFLHRLAQREFGPMATGIVGISELQLDALEKIVEDLRKSPDLFEALIRSFIFQDLGRVPYLREKYKKEINPADLSDAGAFFVEKENIAKRYHLNKKGNKYLIFLIKYHDLLHHILRGEIVLSSIQEVLNFQDKEVFDAFFVISFMLLSAIREDLILEDLAGRLFQTRAMCHRIFNKEATLEGQLNELFGQRGGLFCALERYRREGLPEGVTPSDYLGSREWEEIEWSERLRAGRMIFATERLFRLRGMRYVEFQDIVNIILEFPLKYAYKKRNFHSVGYATYEKEVYEAFRVYNSLQTLEEPRRHFILNELVGDKVRIFGYEKTSGYLSYKNQIRLLLVGLLGTKKIKSKGAPVTIDFSRISEKIEKRYEAVNDCLNRLSTKKVWDDDYQLNRLFKAKTGILLKREDFPNLLSVNFRDRINVSHKTSYMSSINNLEQLKNYFHYSLSSLRKHPFYTDDYELSLEEAFERRMTEITDKILIQTERQMKLVKDFEELHNLVADLLERSWDIGFSHEQKHRLNDLYEMRKDELKREKLSELEGILGTIDDADELRDYWESVKWYLQGSRRFFGKEFENLIAAKFDTVKARIAEG